MRKDTVSIYALCEPDLWQEVRYVGASTHPQNRFHAHKSPHHLKLEAHRAKAQWLKALLEQGKMPVLHILETLPREPKQGWMEAERKWIAFYQEQGARLTNISPGGFSYSEEMRERKRELLKSRWQNPEDRANMVANLRAIAANNKGNEAWKAHMSAVAKNRPFTDKCKEAQVRRWARPEEHEKMREAARKREAAKKARQQSA